MKNRICIQLGSNIGNRGLHLELATQYLSQLLTFVDASGIYETEAWGLKDQNSFYNQVLLFETEIGPFNLLKICQKIEDKMGRKRELHWGPRIIDLDIIYYSNKIIFSPNLQIPHPFLQNRRFVLKPLVEIAGSWIHPLKGITAEQLLLKCEDNSEVKLIPD